MYTQKGFTLIELLTVFGIISILVAIGVPSYKLINEHVTFGNDADEVVDALRSAQNRSLTAQGGISHGVHFEEDSFTIFGDNWSSPTYTLTRQLQTQNTFSSGTPATITFSRLTGRSQDLTLVLESSGGKTKTITVHASGKISGL